MNLEGTRSSSWEGKGEGTGKRDEMLQNWSSGEEFEARQGATSKDLVEKMPKRAPEEVSWSNVGAGV